MRFLPLYALLSLLTACSSSTSGPDWGRFGDLESSCIDPSPELAQSIKFAKIACINKAIANGQSPNQPVAERFGQPRLPLEHALDSSSIFFAHRKPTVVQALLNAGADPNKRFSTGSNALTVALETNEEGYAEVAQALIAWKPTDINSVSPTNRLPPLMKAIASKNQIALNALLGRTDLNVDASANGESAVMASLKSRLVELTSALLHRGANPMTATENNDSLLMTALRLKEEAIVRQLFANPRASTAAAINHIGVNGETALYIAVHDDSEMLANELLRLQASPKVVARDGSTVLHQVVSEPLAQTLLAAGANPHASDQAGRTPLYFAVDRSLSGIVRLLLANKANPNDPSSGGGTVLFTALTKNDHETTSLLLQAGADVRRLNSEGSSTLIVALANGNTTGAFDVLKLGADPKVEDSRERTALSLASARGLLDIANALLNSGVAPTSKTRSGRTALHEAGSSTMAKLLVDRGANVNALDNDGNSPVSIQVGNGRTDVVQTLTEARADLNWQSPDGYGLLALAIAREQIGVAEYLIQKGADVNAAGSKVKPLLQARSRAALDLLVKYGVELNDRRKPILDVFYERFVAFPTSQSAELVGYLYKLGARSPETLVRVIRDDAVSVAHSLLRFGWNANDEYPPIRTPYFYKARSVAMLVLFIDAKVDLVAYRPFLESKVNAAAAEVATRQAAYDEAVKRRAPSSYEKQRLSEAENVLREYQKMIDAISLPN